MVRNYDDTFSLRISHFDMASSLSDFLISHILKDLNQFTPREKGCLGFTGQSHRPYILLLDAEYLEAESQDKAR